MVEFRPGNVIAASNSRCVTETRALPEGSTRNRLGTWPVGPSGACVVHQHYHDPDSATGRTALGCASGERRSRVRTVMSSSCPKVWAARAIDSAG